MTEEESKAAELQSKLDTADAKKRADAESGEKLDKLLTAMDSLSKRMDAMEKTPPNKDTTAEVVSDDDEGDSDVEKAAKSRREHDKSMADAQARADSVAHLFGKQAPPSMAGETELAYRRRLLREFQHHSPEFKAVDLGGVKGVVFDAIEMRIFADASEIGRRPPTAGPGELREIKRQDQSGRWISEFVGDSRVTYNPETTSRTYFRGIDYDVLRSGQ